MLYLDFDLILTQSYNFDCYFAQNFQKMQKILVTDLVHDLLLEGFEKAGFQVDYFPEISYTDVFKIIDQYSGLIINSKILVDKKFIDRAINLKFVGRLGSGMEIIDKEYAGQKGIGVFNSPEGNCNAVAEHALGMLLCLANNLIDSDREVRNFEWHREKNRGFEISGKVIGIIGFGYTGESFAQKLLSWDVEILVHDKYKKEINTQGGRINLVSKDELFAESDIISMHLPLTEETKYYVNEEFFNNWRKKGILINTSRGKIVQSSALLEALTEAKLVGACLDVFENEKPENYSPKEKEFYKALFDLKNIVVSPHIAGWTFESKQKLSNTLLNKILNFLNI